MYWNISYEDNAQRNWNKTYYSADKIIPSTEGHKNHVIMTSQLNWHFIITVIYLLRPSDLTRLFPSEEGRSKVMSTSLEWTASPLEEVFAACGSASFSFSLYSVDATVHMVMGKQNKMGWDENYEMRLWRDKKTKKHSN